MHPLANPNRVVLRANHRGPLLGAVRFVIGAVTTPLVGVAGTGIPLPMATLIAALGCASILPSRLVARAKGREETGGSPPAMASTG
jgi:hypothetical protein